MKITETHEYFSSDHEDATTVEVNVTFEDGSSESISIGEGEKEDMYLLRDLSDAFSIADLCMKCYEAGKRGEKIEYELIEERD